MTKEVRIAIVAGETSGDLLASHLIVALRACLPQARFFGIGGPKMDGKGFDSWYPLEKLAVRGYVEVLRHYREISGIRRELKKPICLGARRSTSVGLRQFERIGRKVNESLEDLVGAVVLSTTGNAGGAD